MRRRLVFVGLLVVGILVLQACGEGGNENVSSPPTITAIMPNTVTGSSDPQPLTLKGKNFTANAKVTLYEGEARHDIPTQQITFVDAGEINITATLGTAAGEWTAVVTNPDDGLSSEPFSFSVVAPEKADLIVQNLSVTPNSGAPGDTVTVSFDILN